MAVALIRWFTAYRWPLLAGVATFGMLVVAGGLHARLTGLPAPQLITAWAEWFAALLLLPFLVTLGNIVRRLDRKGPSLLSKGYVIALVVLALDLLMRVLLGLGWEPFFVA